MKKIDNYLIGSDTELFIMDRQTGKFITAEGLVKGTKTKPFNFDPTNKWFQTSLDCTSLEFCIPPTNSVQEWKEYMMRAINYCNSILPDNLCTVALPCVEFDKDQLTSKTANLIGCDQSYLVWSRSVAEKPDISQMTIRASGAHCHVSYDNPTEEVSEKLVKAFDLFAVVPSILIEPENKRREMYGQAGEFRFCPYGVELRSLSNFMVSTPELSEWTYNAVTKAIDFVNNEDMELLESHKDFIIESINSGNRQMAARLVREFEIELP